MQGHYHYDSDEFCENCLPVAPDSPAVDFDYGEQDSPAHCSECHCPLDCRLTPDGLKYVIEHVIESAELPASERNHIVQPLGAITAKDYYLGSRHVEIMRDWARLALAHNPDNSDKQLLQIFLDLTEA